MAECHQPIPVVLDLTSRDLAAWERKFIAFRKARDKATKEG